MTKSNTNAQLLQVRLAEVARDLLSSEPGSAAKTAAHADTFDVAIEAVATCMNLDADLKEAASTGGLAQSELEYRCKIMRDCAKLLAGGGGLDHRSKNELMLQAISMLLHYAEPETRFTAHLADDQPF